MKIKVKWKYHEDEIIDIFGIYWDERGHTIFWGLSDKYNGVAVFSENNVHSESEVEIIDPNINFRTVYLPGHLPGVFHWALIEKNLLDEINDDNSELRKEFLDILRSENVIDW